MVTPGLLASIVDTGHDPFHQHVVFDHKGIFIHLIAENRFDSGAIIIFDPTQRRLNTMKRNSVVEIYIDKLEELFQQNKILHRLKVIEKKLESFSSAEERYQLFVQLNQLDRKKVNLMSAAKKAARRSHANAVYNWSPALEKTDSRFCLFGNYNSFNLDGVKLI